MMILDTMNRVCSIKPFNKYNLIKRLQMIITMKKQKKQLILYLKNKHNIIECIPDFCIMVDRCINGLSLEYNNYNLRYHILYYNDSTTYIILLQDKEYNIRLTYLTNEPDRIDIHFDSMDNIRYNFYIEKGKLNEYTRYGNATNKLKTTVINYIMETILIITLDLISSIINAYVIRRN